MMSARHTVGKAVQVQSEIVQLRLSLPHVATPVLKSLAASAVTSTHVLCTVVATTVIRCGSARRRADRAMCAAATTSAGPLLSEESATRLADKISLLERIRGPLQEEGIPVPGIVVVGNQSSGKSSVLEHISGISFPRAQNTCTRMPAVLQMECNSKAKAPYALVSLDANFAGAQKVALEDVGQRIAYLTHDQTTGGPEIQNIPIHIKVVQKDGPTLCLIDLPGITHISKAAEGAKPQAKPVAKTGQTFDIHEVTTGIVKEYIRQEEMVVLCVVPANDDFGNCEAIKLAQEQDPEGQRTLGVVTKCDEVPKDPGDTDIVEKINMQRQNDVQLHMGFHAVCNRSPKEVKENLSAKDLAKKEAILFRNHPVLRHLPQENVGTAELVRKITDIQEARVNEHFPRIKNQVARRISETEKELQQMQLVCQTDRERISRFLQISTAVCEELRQLSEGTYYDQVKTMRLAHRAFEKVQIFESEVQAACLPDCFSQEMAGKVAEAMQETRGSQLENFLSHPVFRRLVLDGFASKLNEQSKQLIADVRALLQEVLFELIKKHGSEFKRLGEAIRNEIQEFLDELEGHTEDHVNALLDSENYIFTLDPTYLELVGRLSRHIPDGTTRDVLSSIPKKDAPAGFRKRCEMIAKDGSNEQSQSVLLMQISLHAYSTVVKRRIFDHIPMLVYNGVIFHAVKDLQCKVLESFMNADRLAALMIVNPKVVAQREKLEQTLRNLKQAMADLREVA
eukprot:TRINITY_DN35840_c0_g1_i1.p1 TRINITY_DN35840_c0_g1~~TRINITY_DN35840_c0_g1_i1.p1  ORF type:complete len:768 (+),score=165.84 TRINITY_DN35840_c0_g1_i1:91-2304(+)